MQDLAETAARCKSSRETSSTFKPSRAFAAGSGAVVTWGHPHFAGASSQVQEQLRNVQHIQAFDRAFAAILESGAFVTWDDPEVGGEATGCKSS